jgi:flagellar hook protein FlgE
MIDNSIPASGSNGKVKHFALELSNVDLTNEFAMMITHQRSFQAGSRVVTTSDSILSEAINLKR